MHEHYTLYISKWIWNESTIENNKRKKKREKKIRGQKEASEEEERDEKVISMTRYLLHLPRYLSFLVLDWHCTTCSYSTFSVCYIYIFTRPAAVAVISSNDDNVKANSTRITVCSSSAAEKSCRKVIKRQILIDPVGRRVTGTRSGQMTSSKRTLYQRERRD